MFDGYFIFLEFKKGDVTIKVVTEDLATQKVFALIPLSSRAQF